MGYEQDIRKMSPKEGDGSIIVVIATDAPFLPWQLSKISRRAALGIGRLGGGYQTGSGDLFLAFSTANENAYTYRSAEITIFSDELIDPFFKATAEAVEEAIVNALVNAEDMYGRNRNFVPALPKDQLREILRKYRGYLDMAYPQG